MVELYPRFAERAHQVGGNVVINYNASQRFGFWPWRIVRPVVWGTAVKWKTPVDCKQLGGIEIKSKKDAIAAFLIERDQL